MYEYLRKVGFKLDKVSGKVVVNANNYRFPTLSCKLREEIADNFIFTLNYFISDDFNKQSLEFSFEDWYNWKRRNVSSDELEVAVFDSISKNLGFNFFDYFSITETLLTNVYKSRLKGRKAWKKRNWKLPVRWANVYKTFGLSKCTVSSNAKKIVDLVNVTKEIIELDGIMNTCIAKAAKDFSYAPFDVYFDCFKRKMVLERIIYEENILVNRTNRDKVFKEFAKQVLSLQKGQ